MPYFIIIVYWLIGELKDRGHPLYDEKQRSDLTRAGITTWLISTPAMGILFLLDYAKVYSLERILWFPFYLFLTLLVFSGGTLCYFKKS